MVAHSKLLRKGIALCLLAVTPWLYGRAAGDTISGGLQAVDGQLYYVTEEEEAHAIHWIAASGGTPTLVRDDLYYTNDYVIDGCAIIMGTAEGELVRTAR